MILCQITHCDRQATHEIQRYRYRRDSCVGHLPMFIAVCLVKTGAEDCLVRELKVQEVEPNKVYV